MKPYPHKANGRKSGRVIWVVALLVMVVLAYVSVRAYKLRMASTDPPSRSSNPVSGLVGKSIHTFLDGARLQSGTGNVATPFPTGKAYLLEFYFYRCPPCRWKHPALQKVDAMTDDSELEIIYVDNGKIDEATDFYDRLSATEKQYYDSAAVLIGQLQIKSFPFEIIIDKDGIIRYVSKGYDRSRPEEYIQETMRKIKTVL